jgi:hypothetical protein
MSAERALFQALEDPQTACFLRTAFRMPEQRPEIVTERWVTKDRTFPSWHVAIIEKPPATIRTDQSLLNIAHIILDAHDGKVLQRWYLQRVLDKEYRELTRKEFSRLGGCKGRNR